MDYQAGLWRSPDPGLNTVGGLPLSSPPSPLELQSPRGTGQPRGRRKGRSLQQKHLCPGHLGSPPLEGGARPGTGGAVSLVLPSLALGSRAQGLSGFTEIDAVEVAQFRNGKKASPHPSTHRLRIPVESALHIPLGHGDSAAPTNIRAECNWLYS